jgi:hypothetical protein
MYTAKITLGNGAYGYLSLLELSKEQQSELRRQMWKKFKNLDEWYDWWQSFCLEFDIGDSNGKGGIVFSEDKKGALSTWMRQSLARMELTEDLGVPCKCYHSVGYFKIRNRHEKGIDVKHIDVWLECCRRSIACSRHVLFWRSRRELSSWCKTAFRLPTCGGKVWEWGGSIVLCTSHG